MRLKEELDAKAEETRAASIAFLDAESMVIHHILAHGDIVIGRHIYSLSESGGLRWKPVELSGWRNYVPPLPQPRDES